MDQSDEELLRHDPAVWLRKVRERVESRRDRRVTVLAEIKPPMAGARDGGAPQLWEPGELGGGELDAGRDGLLEMWALGRCRVHRDRLHERDWRRAFAGLGILLGSSALFMVISLALGQPKLVPLAFAVAALATVLDRRRVARDPSF